MDEGNILFYAFMKNKEWIKHKQLNETEKYKKKSDDKNCMLNCGSGILDKSQKKVRCFGCWI